MFVAVLIFLKMVGKVGKSWPTKSLFQVERGSSRVESEKLSQDDHKGKDHPETNLLQSCGISENFCQSLAGNVVHLNIW